MTHENSTTSLKMPSTTKTENSLEIAIPVVTVSEANGGKKTTIKRKGEKPIYRGEHWTQKHRRHKKQKSSVALMLRHHTDFLRLPCRITLTRLAPDRLDRFDNLPMAMKWILDAVCELLAEGQHLPGHADRIIEDEIDVIYKQLETKEYGVIIKIELT